MSDMKNLNNLNNQFYTNGVSTRSKPKTISQTNDTAFAAAVKSMGNGGLRPSRVETSTVDDFIHRHPDSRYQVERMVDAGKNVLSKFESDKVDEMSMDEYKHYRQGSQK